MLFAFEARLKLTHSAGACHPQAVVWIEASARVELTVYGTKTEVRTLINDVPQSGRWFPGVDRIDDQGNRTYHWQLAERRTLGTSFRGDYISQYRDDGDDIVWETRSGNMKTRGRWHIEGPDGRLRVSVSVTTELDAPVPRILKKPATLFAEKETRDGLKQQLARLKEAAEAKT